MKLPAGMLAAVLVAGCGTSPSDDRHLTVYAAASLREVFTTIGAAYEQAHPGTAVVFSFAGSRDLVAQLEQGASADVLATADTRTMGAAAGMLAADPVVVATNTLAIAVPPGNPAGIGGLADLGRPGLRLVVCAPAVPCGAAAQQMQRLGGLQWRPVSEEASVSGVLGKVAAGEADAGVVYATDTRGVDSIAIPADRNVTTRVSIAPLTAAGAGFASFVSGQQAQSVLETAGFGPP